MAGVFKNFLPVMSSVHKEEGSDDDHGSRYEYSFAIEYTGPLVSQDIPRAMPVEIDQIPVAAPIVSGSLSKDVALPVVQPIGRSSQYKKKVSKDPKLGSVNGAVNGDDLPLESSAGASRLQMSCSAPINDCRQNSTDAGENSGDLDVENGDECTSKSSEGMQNSQRLGDCNNCDSSQELSGSLKMLPDDSIEHDASGHFQGYMNPSNHDSVESSSSISHSASSEIFSCKEEEDCIEEPPGHVKRQSAVTFCDPESSNVGPEQSEPSEAESSIHARRAIRPGKKGTCYRCLGGNRFTEKEVCIVCGAKYCHKCVVRAMGSMPEGRKCVVCIGERIDESSRKTLGKSSRLLKKLFDESQVKQIMSREKFCEVNLIPAELIYVNGQSLSQEEIFRLHTSPNPPKKLKPGRYWYDKVSGFWGKEGQKPCQIISPQLNVGDHIKREASNGKTGILINNREITSAERTMLQLVGVQCEGAMSLWLNPDGSYQEEGMNAVKGNIWVKNRTKYICVLLALPTPPNSSGSSAGELNNAISNNVEHKMLCRCLLVGNEKSGTSTIFKQAKIVYNVSFTEEERESIKFLIQSNLYAYLGILLEGRQRFEEECLIKKTKSSSNPSGSAGTDQMNHKTLYSISHKLQVFSEWLLQIIASGNLKSIFPAATREYAPMVEELWNDAAFQATYDRRNELESLPIVATYFLQRAAEVARADYQPSDMDILYAEGITSSNGISCMEFSFPESPYDNLPEEYNHDSSVRYQLIRAHPRILGGNCKWLEMFEEVDMVLFCVSLTDYDEVSEDQNGVLVNKMMANKQLFERIVTHPTLEDKKFLLILNKFDLLEEKIDHVPLTRCEWFHDFNPVIGYSHSNYSGSSRSTNTPLAHRAFQYIAVKFKRLFNTLTDRKLYVSQITDLEPDNVDEAFKYAREIIRYWDREEFSNANNEMSSASVDASSSC